MKAGICEIFESIQGEGIYQGQRHIFVRFTGCNLNCSFCDTDFDRFTYMTIDDVLSEIYKYEALVVALTGGEPLLHIDFLKELCPGIKKINKKIYLETNGTLCERLCDIAGILDIISMDFKLPSVTNCAAFWEKHKKFLDYAHRSGSEVFVKAVIGANILDDDVTKMSDIINSVHKDIKVVLQPQHPYEDCLRDKVLEIKEVLVSNGLNVSISEQLHKKLGVR